ncbi:hypothetical protein LPIBR_40290 [Lacticaseibacillus paracasei]|nr:hypothetical protein LPIBR_40290 [Lacticaseibacillus paracasei]
MRYAQTTLTIDREWGASIEVHLRGDVVKRNKTIMEEQTHGSIKHETAS